jgi:hypothetical protein
MASVIGLVLFALALVVERVSMPWRFAGNEEIRKEPGRERQR